MRVKGASTICDLASWIIYRQWNAFNPQWTYRLPLSAKMLLTKSCLAPTIEHPQRVHSFGGGSEHYTEMNWIVLFLNRVLRGHSLQSFLEYNFTNMHSMSHRSDFFAYSCRVNIWKPAVCLNISLLSAVSRVRSPSFLIQPAMWVSKSVTTS
jgi:hypothetical protein